MPRVVNYYEHSAISTGYMVQLVEWPEVITEGESLAECREMLEDALDEMVLAYRQQGKDVPVGKQKTRY